MPLNKETKPNKIITYFLFGKVFWCFSLVHLLHRILSVIIYNPFFIAHHNAVKKWVIFVTQKNQNNTEVLNFFWFVSIPLWKFLDFKIWCKCETVIEWFTFNFSAIPWAVLHQSTLIMAFQCRRIFVTLFIF